jgi:fructose-1,6-bisphosphatase II
MTDVSLDLVRATEQAALAAYPYVGRGPAHKEKADHAATEAIRERLNKVFMCGTVKMGEGEKDNSYGLFTGEQLGNQTPETPTEPMFPNLVPHYDIAVDPIDGTRPTVNNTPGAISTIAMANKDCLYVTKYYYMLKAAYDWRVKRMVDDLETPLLELKVKQALTLVAKAKEKKLSNVMVCVIDRPRHSDLITHLRDIGVKLKIITDCDVTAAIAAASDSSSVDILYGVGGAPEGVLSAAAMKCLGGGFEGSDWEKSEYAFTDTGSFLVDKPLQNPVLSISQLVDGPCVFAATGITSGSLLPGVKTQNKKFITESIAMRSKSGTIRYIQAEHGN